MQENDEETCPSLRRFILHWYFHASVAALFISGEANAQSDGPSKASQAELSERRLLPPQAT
eukprot:2344203-Amphidinium_carterae.1